VEVSGYILVVTGMLMGFISPRFAVLFVLLAVLYGMLLSQLAAGIETFLSTRYPRMGDRLLLFCAAFLEFLGYRQFLAVQRSVATVQAPFKKGSGARCTGRNRGLHLQGRGAPGRRRRPFPRRPGAGPEEPGGGLSLPPATACLVVIRF